MSVKIKPTLIRLIAQNPQTRTSTEAKFLTAINALSQASQVSGKEFIGASIKAIAKKSKLPMMAVVRIAEQLAVRGILQIK
jgi:hypothetical protein